MEIKLRPEINDELFDAILKVAAKDAMHREMDEMPSLEELNAMYPTSQAFDKKVYGIIKKENLSDNRKARIATGIKVVRSFAKVAAVLCIAIVVSFSALMTSARSRNYILNLLIDIRTDHVGFDFGQGEDVPVVSAELPIGYIPEGFTLTDSHNIEGILSLFIFTNGQGGDIVVEKSTLVGSRGTGTTGREFSIIEFRGQEAYLFEAVEDDARNQIAWIYSDNIMISVSTTLSLDELFRIAESVIIT